MVDRPRITTIPAKPRELALLSEQHRRLALLFDAFCAAHDLPVTAVFHGVAEGGVLVQLPAEPP